MKKFLYAFGLFLVPLAVFAQTGENTQKNLGGLVKLLGDIVSMLIPIASMLVLLFFFYGLAVYILHAGDPEKAAEGKSIMIWGILALFVMTSLYGIIGFMQRSLGTDKGGTPINVIVPNFVPGGAV
jgi:hypothetical protein